MNHEQDRSFECAGFGLKIGDKLYSVARRGKEFEVTRYDVIEGVLHGYYLAHFKGNQTEAIYIPLVRGSREFYENFCWTRLDCYRAELLKKQKEIDILKAFISRPQEGDDR